MKKILLALALIPAAMSVAETKIQYPVILKLAAQQKNTTFHNGASAIVNVYGNGAVWAQTCTIVELQTFPVQRQRKCTSGWMKALDSEKLAKIQANIEGAGKGKMVRYKQGDPICTGIPREVATYTYLDQSCYPNVYRYAFTGSVPCGTDYYKNDSDAAGELVGALEQIRAEHEKQHNGIGG